MGCVEDKTTRKYKILVYGIDKKGLSIPTQDIRTDNFQLVFKPFKSSVRFQEYDGVFLFQGIFETFKEVETYSGDTFYEHQGDNDELDKRHNELKLLLEKGGFLCLILCEPFIDEDRYNDFSNTDLAKRVIPNEYRKNYGGRLPGIKSSRGEFDRFLGSHGAAWSFFQFPQEDDIPKLATIGEKTVGFIVGNKVFIIPALIPDSSNRVEEYFRLLAEAVTSTFNKLIIEVPGWAKSFKFSEEDPLEVRKLALEQEVQKIDVQLNSFKEFKAILVYSDWQLVEAVSKLFQNGFGFPVDPYDEYREDLKILNENDEPIIFVEIKGTNKGVKREHVNQVDSHRERAGLTNTFPGVLIINTHIKNARNLEEKDKEIPSEQVLHAKKINVLILRTLDLIYLLEHKLKERLKTNDILELFQNNSGWLRVNEETWKVNNG